MRCLICNNEGLKAYVDAGLNKGLSNNGIAAAFAEAGGKIDVDTIGRHKRNHWEKPVDPGTPQPTKRDLAILVRDRVAHAIEHLPEPLTEDEVDPILAKQLSPGITMGLRAQALLDKRESTKQKLGLAAGYLGLQLLLRGISDPPPAPVMIDDGSVVEGHAVEVD